MDTPDATPLVPDATDRVTLPGGGARSVLRMGGGREGATPLLLVHGMAAGHGQWGRRFVDGLVDAGRAIVSINHRGVAGSTQGSGGYTVADLADDQAAALDALDIAGAVDVFGNSLGGMVAQELALRHPARVRSLVLGSTTAGGSAGTATSPETFRYLTEAFVSGDGPRALRASWEVNVSAAFGADLEAFAEFRAATTRDRVSLRVVTEQMQAIAGHDAADRLERIRVPVTVAHGTEDRMLPYANATVLVDRIPGAHLETFEGAGHLFFWEDPERTVRIIGETAARADRSRTGG